MPADVDAAAHDLRSFAQERKRQSDIKSKWEPKWAVGGIDSFRLSPSGKRRPARRCSQKAQALDRRLNEKTIHRASINRKQDVLATSDIAEDTSTDDCTSRGSSSPSFNEDIDYSFDGKGPLSGSQVLGAALNMAVQRFENRLTDKLIQDEYEVLEADDELQECSGLHFLDAEDQDFEFI